jgi:hypothetical protein
VLLSFIELLLLIAMLLLFVMLSFIVLLLLIELQLLFVLLSLIVLLMLFVLLLITLLLLLAVVMLLLAVVMLRSGQRSLLSQYAASWAAVRLFSSRKVTSAPLSKIFRKAAIRKLKARYESWRS